MVFGSKVALLFLATVATTRAFEAANTLVASSPFNLFLQPTFVKLSLEAQTIAAQAVGNVLSSATSDLEGIDVVIQNVLHQPSRRRLNSNLQLPSTTLTFAVLGTFSNEVSGQRDYLNTLIQDTFTSNAGKDELLQSLKSAHSHFKDLVSLQVSSTTSGALGTSTENDTQGFLSSLSVVDICLVAVSVCVLLGVTYMVVMSHRANRREHRRVLQLLENQEAAAANSLRALQDEVSASISSRLQLIKSNVRLSTSSMTITPLDKPTEEEEATDDEKEHAPSTENETKHTVEQVPSLPSQKSSSSYHSASETMAASQEIMSNKSMRSNKSTRSQGVLSDHEVIPSPQSSSDKEDDTNYSEASASGYSSGISSARFSNSRWFHQRNNTNVPTPSKDTFDVSAIDVEKYDDKLLLDDGSKTEATENFLEEWVKAIQVVPGERSSVEAPGGSAASTGSASTPERASVQSGTPSKDEIDKKKESLIHETAPEKSEAMATPVESAPVEQV